MQNKVNKMRNKQRLMEAKKIIKTIIDNWDPVGLFAMRCPPDEYDSESKEVTLMALTPFTDNDLGAKIHIYFLEQFGADVFKSDLKECIRIGRQINQALTIRPQNFEDVNIIEITPEDIIHIEEKGLTYKNKIGIYTFIDFAECRQGFINYVTESGDFSNMSEEFKMKTKCVALRDVISLIFEFYSTPKVRIVIKPANTFWDYHKPSWKNRYLKKFYEIRFNIESLGWTTFDIT